MRTIVFTIAFIYQLGIVCAQGVFNPPNIGFESNTFSNWYLYTGSCCPGGKTNATTYTNFPVVNRHTITNGSGLDVYGSFPIVSPDGENYSVRLGNNLNGKQAERMRYYLRVPLGLNNYSLIFRYAVVFQDPGHPAVQQPRFEVSAFDSASLTPISCAQFSYIASSSLPGFTHSPVGTAVIYRPWSTGTIDLSGFGGTTVAIDFATGDCNEGGHFGYAYIDMSCGLFAISGSICKGSINTTLNAPSGFQSYAWCDTNYVVFANTQNVVVPTPEVHNKYIVILTPYPGYGCPDTLSSELFVSDLNVKIQTDTAICKGQPFQLKDTATIDVRFLPLKYKWLSDSIQLSCTTCLNPIVTQNKLSSNYILKVTDSTGCSVIDTVNIRRRTVIAKQQNKFPMTCRGNSIILSIIDSGNIAFTSQWYKNGVVIPGETGDTLVLTNIQYNDTGYYMVRLINSCDTTFSDSAQLKIYQIPRFTKQVVDMNICKGTKGYFIALVADTTNKLQWLFNGIPMLGKTNDTLTIDSVLTADTGAYCLRAIGQCDTIYSDTAHILFKTATLITAPLQPALSCIGDSVTFTIGVVGDGVLNYVWYKDTAVIFGLNNNTVWIKTNKLSDFVNYKVTVYGGCGKVNSTSVKISMKPLPPPIFADTTKVCTLNNLLLETGYDQYIWSTGDKVNYTNINSNGTYRLRYRKNNQCNNIDSTYIQLWSLPQINIGNDTLLCNEAMLQLHASTIDADTIQWMDIIIGQFTNNHDPNATLMFTNKPVGILHVIGTAKNYCGTTVDSLNLSLVNKIKATFTPMDTMVCEKSPAFYLLPQVSSGVFEGNQVNDSIFDPVQHGDYIVTYRLTEIGCTDTVNGMIHVNTQPKADFVFTPDSPFINQPVEFTSNSTNAITLIWKFGNGKTITRNVFTTSFGIEGIYPVELVVKNYACLDSITKDVIVDFNRVWIPDAFTPNGDSQNDVFRPGLYRIKKGNLSIYDRWGAQIFFSDDLGIGWDGKFNGKLCPDDVYTYLLKYEEIPGTWREMHGTVTLMR